MINKKKYSYQKFIHELDTTNTHISYIYPTDISSKDNTDTETINVSCLDSHIDTISEFDTLISKLKNTNIRLIDDRQLPDNCIIKDFADYTLKGYVKYFSDMNKECVLCRAI